MNPALLRAAALAGALVAAPAWAGTASWYGPGFHGRLTASGERYDQHAATCAHRSLPFDTLVRIRNLDNGRSAFCRVTDRGPFAAGRVIDVSRAVAQRLGMIRSGVAPVRITVIN